MPPHNAPSPLPPFASPPLPCADAYSHRPGRPASHTHTRQAAHLPRARPHPCVILSQSPQPRHNASLLRSYLAVSPPCRPTQRNQAAPQQPCTKTTRRGGGDAKLPRGGESTRRSHQSNIRSSTMRPNPSDVLPIAEQSDAAREGRNVRRRRHPTVRSRPVGGRDCTHYSSHAIRPVNTLRVLRPRRTQSPHPHN